MSSLRFLSLRIVLDIAHVSSSQDSRIVKLQKKRIQNLQNLIDRETNSTNQELNSTEFKSSPKPAKHLGFVSNTTRYKRKILNYILEVLGSLVSYSSEICEVL